MKTNNTITIIKKEFSRFFGDRAMVFSTIIMPGLLIYIIYSLMGNGFTEDKFIVKATDSTVVYAENMPETLFPLFDSVPALFVTSDIDVEDVMQRLTNKENNIVYMNFPPDFDSLVSNFDPTSGALAPNIRIFYNSTNDGSNATYNILVAQLGVYENSRCNLFDINRIDDETFEGYDQSSVSEVITNILSELIPMLLMMLLFSGCMAVGPASIAGEKERGTIATLLVTPMKRSQLALGKIISLSIFALLSGVSSFLGIILSLPKMLHTDEMGMDLNIYSTNDFVLLLCVLLSTVLLLISVIANLSALAKDVKQASTINLPLSLLMIVVGMMPLLTGGTADNVALYCIPFYNSIMAMTAVLAHEATTIPILLTLGCNLLYVCGGAVLLTRLFNSEKVMFGK